MCRWAPSASSGTMPRMLGMRGLPPNNPQGFSPEVAALIAQLQQQVQDQAQQLSEREQALVERDRVLAERDKTLAERDALLQRKDREIALREAKIEKINFELARLKRWTYGAKSEAMNADHGASSKKRWPRTKPPCRHSLSSCAVKPRPQRLQLAPSPRRRASRVARHCRSTCVASSIAMSPTAPTARSRTVDGP